MKEKFKSKNELYRFLAQDCGAYLPKKEATNVYFLKDIMLGKKEVSLHISFSFTFSVHKQEGSQGFCYSPYYWAVYTRFP